MGYFKLLNHAKMEYDKKGGSIINLFNYKRIHLDKKLTEGIIRIMKNSFWTFDELDDNLRQLVIQLTESGMGYIYDEKVYVEEYKENTQMELRGLDEVTPVFEQIFIEISDECNAECSICNSQQIVNRGCYSCRKWKKDYSENVESKLFNYEELLERMAGLFINEFVFSGGNPFLEWKKLKKYIKILRKNSKNVNITIISNGLGITEEMLNFCITNTVQLGIIILGYDEKSYNNITGISNAYNEVMDLIFRCINKNLDYQLTILAEGKNIELIKENLEKLKLSADFISEIYKSNSILITSESYEKRKNRINKRYRRNEKFHTCLCGRLAINLNGRIQPCPMISQIIADLNNQEFETPFQNRSIDAFWRLTKNKINTCKNCPYKYSCEDCAVIELGMDNNIVIGKDVCERIGE